MKQDRIYSVLFFAFGAWLTYEASKIPYLTEGKPGSGFFPLWVGIFLMALSVALFVGTRSPDLPFTVSRSGLMKASVVALSFPVYGVVIGYLGMILSMILYAGFLMGIVERKKWLETGAVAVLSGLACHLVFRVWLHIQLPIGSLELF